MALSATWNPPTLGQGSPSPPKKRITPDPCPIMCRAAALEVRNIVLTFSTDRQDFRRRMRASARRSLAAAA
jgi:hypothetical protein